MLRIVCIQAHNFCGRGSDYANILYDSVRRNLPDGMAGTFECFTDDATGLAPGITPRPLPEPGLTGWWHKLSLFKPGLFDDGDRILYLDLDTVITGRLDELVAWPRLDYSFGILRDFWRPEGYQSSVMSWKAGHYDHVWDQWTAEGRPEPTGGDQGWLEVTIPAVVALQDAFPDLFVSYKATGGKIPEKASVVVFHGEPRPHEVTTGWVPEVWKIGGLTRSALDSICNTARDALLANVASACKRDLPWLDLVDAHDGHAVIVGGGPSLDDTLWQIKRRVADGQRIFAINGSIAWLWGHGIASHYHVIADARLANAEFVRPDPIFPPRYLLASQCDPTVFDAVDGQRVMLWHSGAPGVAELLADEKARPVHLIGGGSTAGLSAIVLAYALGYRNIHLFGFDSSMRETDHHAYPQAGNDGDLIVDAIAGDRKFRATPWMVQQAEEFCTLALELAEKDCTITVAGDGLLPHLARQLMQPQITAADVRAGEILKRLNGSKNLVGAEIGVFGGDLSARLLGVREDLTLYMVDSWEGGGAAYRGDGDWHSTLSQEQQDGALKRTQEQVAFAGERAHIWPLRSIDAARLMEGDDSPYLDFVFIDADHSYEACKADIEAWWPKVKPGGLVSGHDYANYDFPHFGVTRAVDEFAAKVGQTVDLGENFTWFLRRT